ncbi:O-antigen ligase family protein [Sinorhizobium sp. BG8]|uniref:O-antigen ligase family protein n=1 Tax=Sinorhizobium sp. BG8 TaxID=2613773 RepID=UPI00193E3B5E|nr:O-antigen ligase family protein [Sinorhizobium sp. BG8]QRM53583.1 O-antigen ligase family protein [Sinorhizobium sp. BG8]
MTTTGLNLRSTTLRLVPDQSLYALMLLSTIVFWLLGILTLVQAIVVVVLAYTRAPSGVLARLVALSWISIGVAQFCASILAGIWREQPGEGIAQVASFGVMGWIVAGLAIWAGAAHRLSGRLIIRSITILGGFIIALAAIGAVGVALGLPALYSPYSLPLLIAPNSVSARLYGSVAIYISEETLGELTTRLILFYPYTTALGLGGIGITLISLLEKDWRFRLCGMAGGLIAVVFSWSRISLGALVICAVGWCWLKASLKLRLAFVGLGLGTLFVLSIADVNWPEAIADLQNRIDGVRAGSSLARQIIYEKSWEGFLQSPVFGHGWIGPSVHPKEMLPIGSHSTFYGLLYTGGALTFGAFAIAIAMTLVAGVIRLLTVSPERRDEIIVMILLSATLLIFCKYESLFSITLPCTYIFAFIGGALEPRGEESSMPSTSPSQETRFSHERARPAA